MRTLALKASRRVLTFVFAAAVVYSTFVDVALVLRLVRPVHAVCRPVTNAVQWDAVGPGIARELFSRVACRLAVLGFRVRAFDEWNRVNEYCKPIIQ